MSTKLDQLQLTWLVLSAVGFSKLKRFNFERYKERPFTEAVEVDCVSGCAMMIRRDLLEELGGFDEESPEPGGLESAANGGTRRAEPSTRSP